MNLILLGPEDFAGAGRARISGERLLHLRKVLKIESGDSVRVGLLGGKTGRGKLLSIDKRSAELEVVLDGEPPPAQPLTLVLALPRPHSLRKVLFFAAETGIGEVHLVRARRVEKSYFSSKMLEPRKIDEILRLGLMQGERTVPPTVRVHHRFRPFAEEVLPSLAEGVLAVFGHPGAPPLWRLPPPLARRPRSLLSVGPEGGWVPYEEDKLAEAGLAPVSPGPSILRVEDAVTALAAQIAFLRREEM